MKPPRLAARWLRLWLEASLREDILRDLEHHFEQRRRIQGTARAQVWYWRQAAMATVATITSWKDRTPSATARRNDWAARPGFESGRLLRELRGAVRSWRHDKVVAIATIITLALGIGSVTAIYSVLHATVLRPLPYPEPDRLVFIWSVHHQDGSRGVLSGRSFHELSEEKDVFRELAQMKGQVDDVLQTDYGAVAVRRRSVSHNFLGTYGVTPVLGRDFRAEDRRLLPPETIKNPNAQWPTLPAVIAHEFWEHQYGGDPSVLGRILRVSGRRWEVIGVMPAGFRTYLPAEIDSSPIDLWYLSPWDERLFPRTVRFVSTVGRLAPGVTVAEAQMAVDAKAQRIRDTEGDMREADLHFQVVPLHGEVFVGTLQTLVVSLSAVSLMLLITCTSAANLLLARGTARVREMAVREPWPTRAAHSLGNRSARSGRRRFWPRGRTFLHDRSRGARPARHPSAR